MVTHKINGKGQIFLTEELQIICIDPPPLGGRI